VGRVSPRESVATLEAVSPDPRRTKIVATIGPASSSHEVVTELAKAGVDAFRLNFSHGTHEQHANAAQTVRAVQSDLQKALALIADLQGPKLRIGALDAPRVLVKGDEVVVVGEQAARDGELPLAPDVIGEVLMPGHDVLIDDGLVRLAVEEVSDGRARCRVVVGGEVKTHKGVNLPGVPVPIPSLTKKDLEDLSFALGLGVDYVALSFVRAAADVRDLQAIIRSTVRRARDREDREGRGGRGARRRARGSGRRDGGARRPGRRDGRRDRAAAAEADHPSLPRGREAGDHGDADARVDDRARRADPRGGERRRERDPRRHVRRHALRRDRDR
jgi:Pyruvate kinase